ILYREKARYTEEARQNRIQGTVMLTVVFGADGRVHDIRTIHGLSHGLTETSIEAAQKIRFQPAFQNGKPVSVRATLEYNVAPYCRRGSRQSRGRAETQSRGVSWTGSFAEKGSGGQGNKGSRSLSSPFLVSLSPTPFLFTLFVPALCLRAAAAFHLHQLAHGRSPGLFFNLRNCNVQFCGSRRLCDWN